MHASSLENMHICFERYIATSTRFDTDNVSVLDVGGADINGGYSSVFSDPRFNYLTVDIQAGHGVDIVLQDPYKLPVDDASVDIVLSGQMLEHCEFFWLTFQEMVRVLKPGGYIFLIAPSAGPIHLYPVDCYRFYPDAYRALAKYANCHAVDIWLDERGPWRDLVGVFTRHRLPDKISAPLKVEAVFDPVTSPPGTPEEEVMAGQRPYIDVLKEIHENLAPQLYLEIGVRHGRSLALAQNRAVGVDPAPDVKHDLSPGTEIFSMTSDAFFRDKAAEVITEAPALVFIDGMHVFEYALRDFMNAERLASEDTIIVIDDIYPNHPTQAARTRASRVWTGDIWKLQVVLKTYRPDLILLSLDTHPTGLLVVAGLNPASRVLWDSYNPIVRQYRGMEEVPEEVLSRAEAVAPNADTISEALDARFNGRTDLARLIDRLKTLVSKTV